MVAQTVLTDGALAAVSTEAKVSTVEAKVVQVTEEVAETTAARSATEIEAAKHAYNMVEAPGPLPTLNSGAAGTFRSGMYSMKVLEEDTIFYRSGKAGGGENALGQYFTRDPATTISGRIDSAVKAQWIDPKTGIMTGDSPLETVYAIKIPKGTTIYEGPAGYQGSIYLGGGNQIFISKPWELRGVQVISEVPIK